MAYPEYDCRLKKVVLRAIRERVRELIRDRELASSHQLANTTHADAWKVGSMEERGWFRLNRDYS